MTGPDDGNGGDRPGIDALSRRAGVSSALRDRAGHLRRAIAPRTIAAGQRDHYLVLRLGRHQETLLTSLPDEAIAARFDEYGYAMVVADGMGGTGAGEAASHLAIATLVYLVRHFGKWNLRVDDAVAQEIMARVERFYRHVDSAVVHQRRHGTVRDGSDDADRHLRSRTRSLLRPRRPLAGVSVPRRTPDAADTRPHHRPPPVDHRADGAARGRERRRRATSRTSSPRRSGCAGRSDRRSTSNVFSSPTTTACWSAPTASPTWSTRRRSGRSWRRTQSPDDQCRSLVDLAMAAGGDDDVTALVARYRIP